MTPRHIPIGAAAALLLVCVSCARTADGLSQVRGKVVCSGQPAAGAVLFFHRQAGAPAPPLGATNIIPSATVRDDGTFTVESQPLGYGAAPGKYKILVQWPEDHDPAEIRGSEKAKVASVKGKTVVPSKHDKLKPNAPDRLKGRYSDASKPLLEAEVKAGPNDLGTFELVLTN